MSFGCFAGMVGWDCSMAWIVMIVIFFVGAIFRRQVADNLLSMPFSLMIGTIAGEIGFIIFCYLIPIKWAFLGAIIVNIVVGFIAAPFDPFASDGGYE